MSTPARVRSAFGQFQLNRSNSSTMPGVDYSKVKRTSTADMAAWIRGGVTLHDTAKAFGVSDSTVRQRLITNGWSSATGEPVSLIPEPEPEPDPETVSHPAFAFVDQPWADQALCAQTDPEVFFPEKGGETRTAKAVCAGCLVAAECLDYALTTNERFGVWGGLSERERRKLTHPDPPLPRTVPCTTPGCPDLFATEVGRDRHARYIHTERTAS
jgi:WhiB family redox-sensing transcriptional regulator